jgi:uncharacterized protein
VAEQLPGLAGPALAGVVVTALADGREGLRDLGARVIRWRVGWRWWASVAGILGLALLGVVAVVLLVNGLGEETGWRGFAVDRLLRDHSFTWTGSPWV